MEVADPGVYTTDGMLGPTEHGKSSGRRWHKHWVPQDTVLGSGKCFLFKWVTEDVLNMLSAMEPVEEEQEREDEHETVYLYTYEGCGKIFPEASGLRKHAHVHGEKQFICHYDGCGKRFVDSSKLKRHFLIHTGEKYFICPFEGCGKAFSLDFNLRSHMRTHTGENYHICPFEECGKRYAYEYKLKAHLRTYHDKENDPKACGLMELRNVPETNVVSPDTDPEKEREIIVPTKFVPPPVMPSGSVEKPFGCPFEGCSKRYIHEYKLNLHLKSSHLDRDLYDSSRRGRASEGEDEIEEGYDQDMREYEEPIQRYYEPPAPKMSQPSTKKRGGSKPPSKGKLRNIEKPSVKSSKRRRPVEPIIKLSIKPPSTSRSLVARQEVAEESEETEDENENTEEERMYSIRAVWACMKMMTT